MVTDFITNSSLALEDLFAVFDTRTLSERRDAAGLLAARFVGATPPSRARSKRAGSRISLFKAGGAD